MNMAEPLRFRKLLGDLRLDEPMARHVSWRTGGRADRVYIPADIHDLASFLPAYLEQDLLPKDPFVTLDADGVGQLVALAVERGRARRPGLKVGVCGEHGGDPASVACFHAYGLDYVSCSPFRVPIARVAAAQAALREVRQ